MTYQQHLALALVALGDGDDAGAGAAFDAALDEAGRVDPEGPRVAEVLTYVVQVHRQAGRAAEAAASQERLRAIHARFPSLAEGG